MNRIKTKLFAVMVAGSTMLAAIDGAVRGFHW